MNINVVLQIFILVFSVIIHEISHGFTALCFGDKTAQYEGRLTLNPIKHLDWFGSIILPLFLYITNAGFMIGWAKPVPYNPYNLKNRSVAEILIALAGPASNLLVATIFGICIKLLPHVTFMSVDMIISLITIFAFISLVNISLAIFNLIPIPPLDGSKILSSILPVDIRYKFLAFSEKYGLILIVAVVVFLPRFLSPIIATLFHLITGLN